MATVKVTVTPQQSEILETLKKAHVRQFRKKLSDEEIYVLALNYFYQTSVTNYQKSLKGGDD